MIEQVPGHGTTQRPRIGIAATIGVGPGRGVVVAQNHVTIK
jgi:hypothetical protein